MDTLYCVSLHTSVFYSFALISNTSPHPEKGQLYFSVSVKLRVFLNSQYKPSSKPETEAFIRIKYMADSLSQLEEGQKKKERDNSNP